MFLFFIFFVSTHSHTASPLPSALEGAGARSKQPLCQFPKGAGTACTASCASPTRTRNAPVVKLAPTERRDPPPPPNGKHGVPSHAHGSMHDCYESRMKHTHMHTHTHTCPRARARTRTAGDEHLRPPVAWDALAPLAVLRHALPQLRHAQQGRVLCVRVCVCACAFASVCACVCVCMCVVS